MRKKRIKAPGVSKNASVAKQRRRSRLKKALRYHTGIHVSPKCVLPIDFKSGWEKAVCMYLDENPDVEKYIYEPLEIKYTINSSTKRVRKYIPDFLIWYKDGKIKMVEVKRLNQVKNKIVQKKAEAARQWCEKQEPKIIYEFWTDKIILPLQKAQKIREQYNKISKKNKKKLK